MDLEQYANILKGIQSNPYQHGPYSNKKGVRGYRMVYHIGGKWYWYSVSNKTNIVMPAEVVEAISKGVVTVKGRHKLNGSNATISFQGHSYMLNEGSNKP